MTEIRYVALGDSFTEGVGDERPDGTVAGWADYVAEGLARAHPGKVHYANLAIRGRLLDQIIDEQLEPALALKPTLLSFNGGGNDMLRPGIKLEHVMERVTEVLDRVEAAGVQMLLLSGPDPTAHLPRGKQIKAVGDAYNDRVTAVLAERGLPYVNNWVQPEFRGIEYWSRDRLHLARVGHQRVAANVLRSMDVPIPSDWVTEAEPLAEPGFAANAAFVGRFVVPWLGRRITRRSSGDGRSAKYADWIPADTLIVP